MVTNELSANNSLKKEVLEYIKTWDRTIIDHSKLEEAKDKTLQILEDINNSNTRCKKLQFHYSHRWGSNHRDITRAIYCNELFTLVFYGEV